MCSLLLNRSMYWFKGLFTRNSVDKFMDLLKDPRNRPIQMKPIPPTFLKQWIVQCFSKKKSSTNPRLYHIIYCSWFSYAHLNFHWYFPICSHDYSHFRNTYSHPPIQWEFQDPQIEVLYHLSSHILCGYSLKFRPYIGLTYAKYLQFRFLKWPWIGDG